MLPERGVQVFGARSGTVKQTGKEQLNRQVVKTLPFAIVTSITIKVLDGMVFFLYNIFGFYYKIEIFLIKLSLCIFSAGFLLWCKTCSRSLHGTGQQTILSFSEIKENYRYLRCIEWKGAIKTFTVVHKMPHYLLRYYEISFVQLLVRIMQI